MIYFSSTKKSGFSLVEMLVSVSILLLVIIGPMTITTRIAKSSTFATEQVQAFFLAQEGLEIVQKVRDDLLLDYFVGTITNPWTRFTDDNNTGILDLCYNGAGCGLEWDATTDGAIETVSDCTNASDCLLWFDADGNRSKFTYNDLGIGNVPTLYTRKITLTETPGQTNQVKVKSVVTWRTGSLVAEQKVEVETYLYNIYATQ
jgi:prepilin-type N-terminal cleavage/methylation domain-containing protein